MDLISSTAGLATASVILACITILYIRRLIRPPSRGGNIHLHVISVVLRSYVHGFLRYFKWKRVWTEKSKNPILRPALSVLQPYLFGAKGEKIGHVTLLTGTKAKNVEELRSKAVLRADDLFVSGFPKTGTTWTQQIAKLIRDNGVESGKHMEEVFPFVDTMTLKEFEALPFPRGFKTHLPYHLSVGGDVESSPAKYIYVYRNPKDILVSHFYMLKGYLPPLTWESYFQLFAWGVLTVYCDPVDHIVEWWEHRDAPNVLIVCYEDMIKDPRGAIEKVAKFLGRDLSAEVVDKIASQIHFKSMKTVPTVNMSWVDQFRDDKNTSFMRKGTIGDWRNHFTKEQSAWMDARILEKVPRDCGLVFDFGDN